MRTIRMLVVTCAVLASREVRADLEPKSRNTVLFVESAQKGHEWEAFRLAEDRKPVVFDVNGPGRVLLTLRTFADPEGEAAISVVLLDERIVLTAKVDPKVDESAKFPEEEKRKPSKVRFYLVRVPPGAHRVSVRYSGGPPTLVAARFSETDTSEELGRGDPLLAKPKPRRDAVPKIGKLRAHDALEAEPQDDLQIAEEEELREARDDPAPVEPLLDPHSGPPRSIEEDEARSDPPDVSAIHAREALMVPAPWLMFEVRAGAQIDRLGLSVAPMIGTEARIPVPGLDARSLSIGLAAEVAYAQGESKLKLGNAAVGLAEARHTAFTASADLRWVFVHDELVDPYLSIGAGALIGSMSTTVGEQRISSATRGGYGLLVAGAALGGLGHRPYIEARLQAGLLSSDMIKNGETAHVAGSVMIGFRFEFLTEAAAMP